MQASPSPGGTFDNSPTFQRWERRPTRNKSRRDGSRRACTVSAVPSGLGPCLLWVPNVETLGYYRPSLRDDERQILLTLDRNDRAPVQSSRSTLGFLSSLWFRNSSFSHGLSGQSYSMESARPGRGPFHALPTTPAPASPP